MRYLIAHEVHLAFAQPVFEHQCEVRLIPSTTPAQRVLSASLTTEPDAEQFTYLDGFGNQVHHFDLADAHEEVITRTRVEIETLLTNPFDYVPVAPERERAWIDEALRAQPRLWDYVLHRSALTPAADALSEAGVAAPVAALQRPLIENVIAVRDWLAETVRYDPQRDTVPAPLAEVVAAGEGNAADLAHLLISILRAWRIPARYVSGYQDCGDDDEEPPRLHAWAEVLMPGAGWRGVDASARLITGDTYVSVAVGRDARDTVAQRCIFAGEGANEPARVAVRFQRQQ
jgi:transglutaminase-like putative cysteine protease